MTIKEEIKLLLKSSLESLNLAESGVDLAKLAPEVDFAANEKFGDLSTNIAMVAHSQLKQGSANAPQAFQSPRQLAEALVTALKHEIQNPKSETTDKSSKTADSLLKKIEVAGPGFINFTLSDDYLLTELDLVNEEKQYFGKKIESSQSNTDKTQTPNKNKTRTIVEFTDPNPFKEFHMGHLFSNIVGESLARIFESQGKEVRRLCYQGDVGMHVAKAIWGMLRRIDPSASQSEVQDDIDSVEQLIHKWESKPLKQRVEFMGKCYADGAAAYEDDEQAKKQIKKINFYAFIAGQKRLIEEENWQPQIDYSSFTEIDEDLLEKVEKLYRAGRAWSLESFEKIYQRLGTKFEDYYFESLVGEYGYKTVKDNIGKVFTESNGAVVFEGEKYGLHTRVFINSMGLPTYEAKDLGLAPKKYEDWPYDESFIITAHEINEYFKVVLKAMSMFAPEIAKKTTHIGHGFLKLPEGKMSSRTGNILTGVSILDEAKERVMEIMSNDRHPELDSGSKIPESTIPDQVRNDELDVIAEQVGQAAVKYALLKSDVKTDVVFDFKESVNFNGNSGPYIQYTFARAMSVLGKWNQMQAFGKSHPELDSGSKIPESTIPDQVRNDETEGSLENSQSILSQLDWSTMKIDLNEEERAVLNWLWRFESAVSRAADEYAPHYIATYIYELAQRFNTFYNKHSILGNAQVNRLKSEEVNKANQDVVTSQPINLSTSNSDQTLLRLALTAATAQVLKNGLHLLGIEAPTKM